MASDHAPDFWVRRLLVAGWACGLVGIVGVGRQPFTTLMAVGGALIIGSGAALAAGGSRAIARLNERYSPWQSPPSHRFMSVLMIMIGVGWIVVALTA